MRLPKTYICDDCKTSAEFSSYLKARAALWAISKDYKNCYCPECAPAHRLGGANGKRNTKHAKPTFHLPKGFEQLKMDI